MKSLGLKISSSRDLLIIRVFAAMENTVLPVKNAIEVELDLKEEYQLDENKLKVDDSNIRDPLKIPHGRMEEDEGTHYWPMLPSPNLFHR